MTMVVTAVAGTVVAGGVSLYEGHQAASAQRNASQNAEAAYNNSGQKKAGDVASQQLSDILSNKGSVDLNNIPGYTAGLTAGSNAITRNAAARGEMGGGTLASLFGFGQQYAGKAFNDYMGQLQAVSTGGAAMTTGAINQQVSQGNIQASSDIGTGKSVGNLITGVTSGISGMFGGGLSNEQWGQQQADLARSNYNIPQ